MDKILKQFGFNLHENWDPAKQKRKKKGPWNFSYSVRII